jgi:L-alanine-DL-glutamate epimerase-like enolase superfamily enzyme
MAAKTREAAPHWKVLKIKLDERPSDEILEVICGAYDGPVRVDANTAWSPETAADQVERLRRFPVELVEQPFPVRLDAELARFRGICPAPLIADESFRQVGDFPGLIGRVDGVNVKLSKCGGIRQALAAIRTARRLGMKVMVGCMTQSSLGISAAAQVAPLVDYVDLDGHLLLESDPWRGLGVDEGRVTLSSGPGLGVRPATG